MEKKLTGRGRKYLVAAAYVVISAGASALFYLGARLKGSATTDAVLGVVWVFALSAIVSASLLPPLLERRERRAAARRG